MQRVKYVSGNQAGQIAELPRVEAETAIGTGFAVAAPAVPVEAPLAHAPEEITAAPLQIRHRGGGWYELPNGDLVRGRDAALRAVGLTAVGGSEI